MMPESWKCNCELPQLYTCGQHMKNRLPNLIEYTTVLIPSYVHCSSLAPSPPFVGH